MVVLDFRLVAVVEEEEGASVGRTQSDAVPPVPLNQVVLALLSVEAALAKLEVVRITSTTIRRPLGQQPPTTRWERMVTRSKVVDIALVVEGVVVVAHTEAEELGRQAKSDRSSSSSRATGEEDPEGGDARPGEQLPPRMQKGRGGGGRGAGRGGNRLQHQRPEKSQSVGPAAVDVPSEPKSSEPKGNSNKRRSSQTKELPKLPDEKPPSFSGTNPFAALNEEVD